MARIPLNEVFFTDTAPPSFARRREAFIYKPNTTEQLTVYRGEEGAESYSQPIETDHTGRLRVEGQVPWMETGNFDVVIGTVRTAFRVLSSGGGGGAVESVNGKTGVVVLAASDVGADASGAAAAAQAASQPLDSDLTAIAALSTTSFGRSFLVLAGEAAARTQLGLGTAAVKAASEFDAAGAATTAETNAKAASQPLDSDLTAIAALTTTTFGRSLLTMAAASNARTALELGTAATKASTEFDASGAAAAAQAASQPLDSDLTAIAALTTTSYGRELLTLANAAAGRTAFGLGSAAVEAASAFLSSANEAVTEAKLAAAVQTKLKGANVEQVGFALPGKLEATTYRLLYIQVASGETKKLVGMQYSIGSGTKAKFSVKQNGTAVSEFKEKEVTTTAAEVTGKSVSLAAKDLITLTVESVEGEPKDTVITLFVENTR